MCHSRLVCLSSFDGSNGGRIFPWILYLSFSRSVEPVKRTGTICALVALAIAANPRKGIPMRFWNVTVCPSGQMVNIGSSRPFRKESAEKIAFSPLRIFSSMSLRTGVVFARNLGSFANSGTRYLCMLMFPATFQGLFGFILDKCLVRANVSGDPNGWLGATTNLPLSGTFSSPSKVTSSQNASITTFENLSMGSSVASISSFFACMASLIFWYDLMRRL